MTEEKMNRRRFAMFAASALGILGLGRVAHGQQNQKYSGGESGEAKILVYNNADTTSPVLCSRCQRNIRGPNGNLFTAFEIKAPVPTDEGMPPEGLDEKWAEDWSVVYPDLPLPYNYRVCHACFSRM
jgi:hypothetical protein